MNKTLQTLIEAIVILIVVPVVVVFRMLVWLFVMALICSPLILIGFIVWVIAT